MMMEITFANTLAALSRSGADYIVVGGLAVAQAGFSRTTFDIDIIIDAAPKNVSLIISALLEIGLNSASELTQEDFEYEEGCVRIEEDFALDIFTVMKGNRLEDLKPLALQASVLGQTVNFLGVEGLILLKGESLREKDQIDVLALKRLQIEKSGANL
jgi:hypothetical protein